MQRKDDSQEDVEDKEYEVEMIKNRKISTEGCYYYEVKWVGWAETTWEPLKNLLGNEAVQKMVADFEKSLEKKNKKSWKNGLAVWANLTKKDAKINQDTNKENLDATFYNEANGKIADHQVIDLEKVLDENETQYNKKDDNPFIGSSVKQKNTSPSSQRYVFQKVQEIPKRPFFMRKVSEIKKVQLLEGVSKCLVKWKAPQNKEEWVPTDIIRLIAPEILVDAYQRKSLQIQKKNQK